MKNAAAQLKAVKPLGHPRVVVLANPLGAFVALEDVCQVIFALYGNPTMSVLVNDTGSCSTAAWARTRWPPRRQPLPHECSSHPPPQDLRRGFVGGNGMRVVGPPDPTRSNVCWWICTPRPGSASPNSLRGQTQNGARRSRKTTMSSHERSKRRRPLTGPRSACRRPLSPAHVTNVGRPTQTDGREFDDADHPTVIGR